MALLSRVSVVHYMAALSAVGLLGLLCVGVGWLLGARGSRRRDIAARARRAAQDRPLQLPLWPGIGGETEAVSTSKDEHRTTQESNIDPSTRSIGSKIERVLVFAIPCLIYLVVGWLLAFRYASFNGDAQARLANGYYVLFSRDPHVAAIGFVWNPLPSVTVMPLLLLKSLWPALVTRAFAGNIMSAIFMAGAGYQLYEFLRDLRLVWVLRVGLVAAFVLNPMIVYYGGNGMSEGLFIFTLVLAARYLARWLVDDRTLWLMVSAAALGLAYLARNEAAFAAFFAALVVVAVSLSRALGDLRDRIYKSLVDGFIFALPFATCFVGWAVISWIIVGHPFEQFQSVYGTSSQLRVINETSGVARTTGQAGIRAVHSVVALAPTLAFVGLVATILSVRRKDWRALASLAIPGGVLLFAVIAYTLGMTAGWFRYYITAIPLLIMLAGAVAALFSIGEARHDLVTVSAKRAGRWSRAKIGTVVARAGVSLTIIAAVAANVPSTASAMMSSVAPEEQLHLKYVLQPGTKDPGQVGERYRYASTVTMAKDLDGMHLSHSAVLVDNFSPCVPYVILNSKHPQQFVIPNDRDFQAELADPVTFHVQYLMVPPGGGYGSLDALNRQYPNLYLSGDITTEVMKQVKQWSLPGCPAFKLYRVTVPRD